MKSIANHFRRPVACAFAALLLLVTTVSAAERAYLLHLPGIGGHMFIDDAMTQGLLEGGIDAKVEILDWTLGNEGLAALMNLPRNQQQATRVAKRLTQIYRENPQRPIILTAHSGGTGLAVWALEQLPDDVHVQQLMLLASALSPSYDLSAALRHVDGRAVALVSAYDPILGPGTRTFGTIDRIYGDSAGRTGFLCPAQADVFQYHKFSQVRYDAGWISLGNYGDHIGTMNRPFARTILAPLLQGKSPATQPSP